MDTPETSAASSASKANSPVTMVVAGILALALGGLGVAAYKMNKGTAPTAMAQDPQSEEAKAKAAERKAADEAAAAAVAKGGTPSKAVLTVAPKEDPALDAPGTGVGSGRKGDYSEDASLK